jgi:hypothetical protein
MGILSPPPVEQKTPASSKRKSQGLDLTSLKPLTSTGTKGFAGYRDPSTSKKSDPFQVKDGKKKEEDAMDSDADDEEEEPKIEEEDLEDAEPKLESKGMLSPEDALRQGELAEGLRKIKVCHHVLVLQNPNSLSCNYNCTDMLYSSNANTPLNPSTHPLPPLANHPLRTVQYPVPQLPVYPATLLRQSPN